MSDESGIGTIEVPDGLSDEKPEDGGLSEAERYMVKELLKREKDQLDKLAKR